MKGWIITRTPKESGARGGEDKGSEGAGVGYEWMNEMRERGNRRCEDEEEGRQMRCGSRETREEDDGRDQRIQIDCFLPPEIFWSFA